MHLEESERPRWSRVTCDDRRAVIREKKLIVIRLLNRKTFLTADRLTDRCSVQATYKFVMESTRPMAF